MKRPTLILAKILAVLCLAMGGQWQLAEAGTISGTVGLGLGNETNDLYVQFDGTSTPGVSITKVTFDTSSLGYHLAGNSGGGSEYNTTGGHPSIFGVGSS
jgi:hypothetical protein